MESILDYDLGGARYSYGGFSGRAVGKDREVCSMINALYFLWITENKTETLYSLI